MLIMLRLPNYCFKLQLKIAFVNEALHNSKMELFHPVGDNCGSDASQLMDGLDAELMHIAYRMYMKGIPTGRQLNKIYAIVSPTYD